MHYCSSHNINIKIFSILLYIVEKNDKEPSSNPTISYEDNIVAVETTSDNKKYIITTKTTSPTTKEINASESNIDNKELIAEPLTHEIQLLCSTIEKVSKPDEENSSIIIEMSPDEKERSIVGDTQQDTDKPLSILRGAPLEIEVNFNKMNGILFRNKIIL